MCSLFGWLDYKGIVNTKILKNLTQRLADAAEERGTDAAGIAYVRDGKVVVYKRPKPAHKMKFNLPKDTKACMGHTRFATQGDKKDNYNNHPFTGIADVQFALAHNGVLYNDKQLRKSMELPETEIKTDSYIAVQILESYKELTLYRLCDMAEELQGTYNFSVLDEYNNLYLVKGNNPLKLLHFAELGIYIYASTESILKAALKDTIFERFNHTVVETEDGDAIKINYRGEMARMIFKPYQVQYYKYLMYDDEDLYENYEDSQLELILDYCKYYGVDEEVVYDLMEYGYTLDEISDVISDKRTLDLHLSYIRGGYTYDETGVYGDC